MGQYNLRLQGDTGPGPLLTTDFVGLYYRRVTKVKNRRHSVK